MIKAFFNKIAGRKRLQKVFELLFTASLKGMNYGYGGNFRESGELFILKYLQEKYMKEDSLTLFDVGANIGNYSRSLASYFGTRATIHSFEPSKKTFETFVENTRGFQNIVPNNIGLSDSENVQILYSNTEGSGLASLYQRKLDHYGIDMDKSEEISLSTIDLYCKKNKIDRIHFLKLDIEGHEMTALQGARNMIKNKNIDAIQFEFGGCNIDSRTYFQDYFYFLKENYRIYRILKDGLYEISKYKETREIFMTINYLAVRI